MTSAVRATTLLALMHALASTPAVIAQEGGLDGAQPIALLAEPLPASGEIRLDGRLDEDAWLRATPITDFTQQEPVQGATPSYPTEVRVMFDEYNLYIGAIIYDDPDGVLAFQRERDARLSTDDRFMWILDTFLDGRTGYFFEINAAGLMGDGIITGGGGGGPGGGGGGGGGTNKAWDGIWEARTSMRPDGWSALARLAAWRGVVQPGLRVAKWRRSLLLAADRSPVGGYRCGIRQPQLPRQQERGAPALPRLELRAHARRRVLLRRPERPWRRHQLPQPGVGRARLVS